MRTGRWVLVIAGALVALIGLGLLAAGGGLLWVHATQRDADGFYTSSDYELTTDGYAVVTERADFGADPGDWFPARDITFRVTAESQEAGDAVFLGIAAADDLAAYLDGVSHDRIDRIGIGSDDVGYEAEPGTRAPAPPSEMSWWVASAEGDGTQTLEWTAERGAWVLAVLNADGSAGLDVTTTAAVDTDLVLPIAIGALVIGLLVVGAATALLVAGSARAVPAPEEAAGVAPVAPTPATAAAVAAAGSGYPVVVRGRLDPQLSRWQWLVKWFLAIPHAIVLALLWVAFVLLTVVAGFAILFTGRYPRGIFDFNVGVLRWTWRVTYYAYGVLGTDRYPPFSLERDDTYPADLDVVYPEQLSRGLVLVKWWLLAIPHYLIIGVFTGSVLTWAVDVGQPGNGEVVAGAGIIGILVFVAAVMLLFSGRYPKGLYDLVMGLQRWVYRVMGYAALMTDEYPPFRLDSGGPDPVDATPPPPPPAPPAKDTRPEHPELVG